MSENDANDANDSQEVPGSADAAVPSSPAAPPAVVVAAPPVPVLANPYAFPRPAPRPRFRLGPSLSVFGVLLWSYLVFGQFTTTWVPGSAPLGEGAAVLGVFACTGAAFYFAVRRSLVVPVRSYHQLVGRAITIAIMSFGFWFLTVVFATVFGQSSRTNLDGVITSFLLLVSGFAVVFGRRITLSERQPFSQLSQRERAVTAVLWTGAVAMTLGACAEVVGT